MNINKLLFSVLLTTVTISINHNNQAEAFTINPNYQIQSRSQDATFNQFFLNNQNDLKQFIHKESKALDPQTIAAKAFNSPSWNIEYDHDIKVYFLGEGAGYRNQLNFTANGGNSQKIFGETSCNNTDSLASAFCPLSNSPNHKTGLDKTLNVGDFVNLGKAKAGDKLDFLLLADQVNGGVFNTVGGVKKQGIYGLDKAKNPDGLQHVMSYFYKNYIILAYEDLWGGGDKDYNDTVFAIDIGANNAKVLAGIEKPKPAPEPATMVGLFGVVGLALALKRRTV